MGCHSGPKTPEEFRKFSGDIQAANVLRAKSFDKASRLDPEKYREIPHDCIRVMDRTQFRRSPGRITEHSWERSKTMNPIEKAGNMLLTAKLDLDDATVELKASGELSFETYEDIREDVSELEDVAQKVRAIIGNTRSNGSNLPVDAIEYRVRSMLNLKRVLETFIDDVTPYVRIIDLCEALESIEAADSVPELERLFSH
jgi:hypothetical protein